MFYAPHSRHTGICREDVDNCAALRILAESDAAGPFLMSTENGRQIFVTGHPEYGPYVAGTGAVLRVVPPQAPTFQPNLDAFAQMLTEKVTCVLINTPNNPTGVVYSADTLTRMAEILTEKSAQYGHNIFLVSDEPYRDIVFDGKTVPYPAAFYPHTLTCFSYSKSLSLPGERLGYVAVRPGCEGEDILVDMMSQISDQRPLRRTVRAPARPHLHGH